MDHYLAYHNIDHYGWPNLEGPTYSHAAHKSRSFLNRTLGNPVWLITGNQKRGRGGTRFRLMAFFTPDKVKGKAISGPVQTFRRPLELNQLVWFRDLTLEQGSFRFDLNRTQVTKAIENFIGTRDGIPRRRMKRPIKRRSKWRPIHNQGPLNLLDRIRLRYLEGTPKTLVLTSYERNPRARRDCLAHYGHACSVCGFDFTVFYGDLGRSFVHVHHLVDIASIGSEYEVDPITDLRPVCPNCHAVLHAETPAMSVDKLRTLIMRQAVVHPSNRPS
jgi:5-methylcytosine-specific restriction endonuclease McrA